MTFLAVRLLRVASCYSDTSQLIYLSRNNFQMIQSYALTVPAPMVQLEPNWHWALDLLVQELVRYLHSAIGFEVAVATAV